MTAARLPYSAHARRRARQRGIPDEMVTALLRYADREVDVGSDCVALRISRRMLRNDPEIHQSLGQRRERLTGIVVVWSNESARIVTVLRDTGRAGRRYRR
jgi:hypothetical protein